MASSRCCVDPRNLSNTYDKGYTVCSRCLRRYYLTDHGWQANPDPRPPRWGK